MKKTLFAVKIKTGRTVREVAVVLAGIGVFGLLIAAMFAVKIHLCHKEHPGRAWRACINENVDE